MKDIELKFITSSTSASTDKGGNTPPWMSNESDYSKWYSTPNAFDSLYFFNKQESVESPTMYIQYGQNKQGWGSGRFFVQQIQIMSQEKQNNGDIKVVVRSRLQRFIQRKTETVTTGYSVVYDLKIFGKNVYSYTGNSMDNISKTDGTAWETETFIVKPLQTEEKTGLEFSVRYPNGEQSGSDVFMGFGLYNPNPLNYTPMASRKSNIWKDFDSNNGKILIRKSGAWVDKSNEDMSTSKEIGKGKNRIRKSNNWRQLPKMNGGNV